MSQAKGLLLSAFVLAVMWPALFLFHWNDQSGGIAGVARLLEGAIPNRGMCRVLLAWSLSGLLEGLAGFGLPIAVVAPMLAALGVPPLSAVAAVAVGHSWAVTFGDMGVIDSNPRRRRRADCPGARALGGAPLGRILPVLRPGRRRHPRRTAAVAESGPPLGPHRSDSIRPGGRWVDSSVGFWGRPCRPRGLHSVFEGQGLAPRFQGFRNLVARGECREATKGRASAFETPPLVGAARINAHPATVRPSALMAL